MTLFLKICEAFGFDPLIQMQQALQAETIEVLKQIMLVSLPYAQDSIEKVSFMVQGEHFDLIVYPNKGLLFSDDQVVFTKDATFPMLEEEQIREMLRMRDNTIKNWLYQHPINQVLLNKYFI